MQNISSKTGNVADFPAKLNLQLFGEEDGTPNLEESAEYEADAREFNAKMDTFAKGRAIETETDVVEQETENPETVEEVEKPEVVDPEKPKQDSETNKAFQEMRKQLEAEKARVADIEARAKKADELIASQYGESHGIYTVEQYEQRLQQEREQENIERYKEAGLTDEEIRKIKDYDSIKQQSESSRLEQQQQAAIAQWQQLFTTYPDLSPAEAGKSPDWYTPEMAAEIERGASPLAAYRNAHFETILQRTLGNAQEAAKQEALDKLNSKEHLAPNSSTGGEVDHVEIDDETMRAYRALNKGKTDAQIRAWHKKNVGK